MKVVSQQPSFVQVKTVTIRGAILTEALMVFLNPITVAAWIEFEVASVKSTATFMGIMTPVDSVEGEVYTCFQEPALA